MWRKRDFEIDNPTHWCYKEILEKSTFKNSRTEKVMPLHQSPEPQCHFTSTTMSPHDRAIFKLLFMTVCAASKVVFGGVALQLLRGLVAYELSPFKSINF